MRRLNLKFDDSEILALFKFDSMDDLLTNLGSGGVTEGQLAQKLAEARQEPEHPLARKRTDLPLSSPTSGIKVLGVGDMLTRMGRCCNPIPRRRDRGLRHPVKGSDRSQADLSQRFARGRTRSASCRWTGARPRSCSRCGSPCSPTTAWACCGT